MSARPTGVMISLRYLSCEIIHCRPGSAERLVTGIPLLAALLAVEYARGIDAQAVDALPDSMESAEFMAKIRRIIDGGENTRSEAQGRREASADAEAKAQGQ